ncbi:hypothetical protein GCM10009647_068360 [Streptomyces sanglieri]
MCSHSAHESEKALIQASRAWQNALQRLRSFEGRITDAFFDLADKIITLRSLTRRARTTHRWARRP